MMIERGWNMVVLYETERYKHGGKVWMVGAWRSEHRWKNGCYNIVEQAQSRAKTMS
jgi:hypothetical protein